jgi:hypothetical protein
MQDQRETTPVQPEKADALMAQVSIDQRFEFFQDYVKTVLNLSTGALVLSITFLHDIVGIGSEHGTTEPIQSRWLLGLTWVSFLISVFGALYYLYFHALAAKDTELSGRHLKWSSIAALGGLFLGLVALGAFGWLNI